MGLPPAKLVRFANKGLQRLDCVVVGAFFAEGGHLVHEDDCMAAVRHLGRQQDFLRHCGPACCRVRPIPAPLLKHEGFIVGRWITIQVLAGFPFDLTGFVERGQNFLRLIVADRIEIYNAQPRDD